MEEGLHRDLLWSSPWGTRMVPLDDCDSNLCVSFGRSTFHISLCSGGHGYPSQDLGMVIPSHRSFQASAEFLLGVKDPLIFPAYLHFTAVSAFASAGCFYGAEGPLHVLIIGMLVTGLRAPVLHHGFKGRRSSLLRFHLK